MDRLCSCVSGLILNIYCKYIVAVRDELINNREFGIALEIFCRNRLFSRNRLSVIVSVRAVCEFDIGRIKTWCHIRYAYCNGNLGVNCPLTGREARCRADFRRNLVKNEAISRDVSYIARIICNTYIDNRLTVRIAYHEWSVICNRVLPLCYCRNSLLINRYGRIGYRIQNLRYAACRIQSRYFNFLRSIEEYVERIKYIGDCRPWTVIKYFNSTGGKTLVYLDRSRFSRLNIETGICLSLECVFRNTIGADSEYGRLILVARNRICTPCVSAVKRVIEVCLTECRRTVTYGYDNILVCPGTVIILTAGYCRYGKYGLSSINLVDNDALDFIDKTRTVCYTDCICTVFGNDVCRCICSLFNPFILSVVRIQYTYLKFYNIGFRIIDIADWDSLGLCYLIRIYDFRIKCRRRCIKR